MIFFFRHIETEKTYKVEDIPLGKNKRIFRKTKKMALKPLSNSNITIMMHVAV